MPFGVRIIIKKYHLKNLDCANCSSIIEAKIQKLAGIEKAAINFIDKKLIIEHPDNFALSIDTISEVVDSVEDGVVVEEVSLAGNGFIPDSENNSGEIRALILRITVGLLFLAAGIFTPNARMSLALYIISYVTGAYPLFKNAFKNLLNKNLFDENFLMVTATIGAFAIGEYHEAIGVTIFFQIGELFEEYSVDKSRHSIKSLIGLRPDYINLLIDGSFVKTDPEKANPGDIFQVKPGEKIPLDGTITQGATSLDVSSLTGESMPCHVKAGERVLSGSLNINGLITVRAEKCYGESTVAKILELIESSAAKKAPTEQFITKFARIYTPAVVLFAVMLCVIPTVFFGGIFSEWLRRALIFLVVSCPCALVLSIPLGFFGGIGCASRRGILIKGGNYLEALNETGIVVFDKTGTITRGNFKVIDIMVEGGTKEEILKYAAAAETHSSHPIAEAIKKAYAASTEKMKIESYEEIRGTGIKAVIDGSNVFVGHDRFLHDENIEHKVCVGAATTVHVVVNGKYSGYIVIADELKPDSVQTIDWLKKNGIKTIMLTGDNHITAENIAQMISVDEYYYELLPHEKVEKLKLCRNGLKAGKSIVFAGDGINDAPVIALADVGIAMGGIGAQAAVEAADIVLMNDNPFKIVEAIKIAKRTRTIVYQNIALALGVKGLFLIFGALGMATMWEAVFADVGVAIIAIFNSMRTLKY